jgi:succinylglutamic semialdehyde dehydrogenase
MSTFSSFNPATGGTVWTGPAAGPADVARAVASARAAFPGWAARTFDARAGFLRVFAAEVNARRDELADLIGAEVGKARWDALGEVQAVIGKIELSVEAHAHRCGDFRGGQAVTRFRPHGVVAVLGPFNFPAHLPNGHIVPALLAGNTVVFKPSEFAPAVAERMVALWRAARLPPGVLELVQGGRETGAALAAHPGLDGLFFTGSARAGRALNELSASNPGRILALEMGGNNPLVVHRVDDVRAAVALTLQSAFVSAGQRCTCARRLVVVTGRPPADAGFGDAEPFVLALAAATRRLRVGRPTDRPEPFLGPVISAAAAQRLVEAQAALVARGARPLVELHALAAGTGLVSPGLLDVTAVADRPDEELFGPLLQVVRVPDFDAALREANATAYGLAAGLLSDDRALYERFRATVRAGIVNWNQPLTGASSAAPFGGVGLSGNHRPSAYFAADYCSHPVASIEVERLTVPASLPPGLELP